jgi:hypothetical protein
MSFFENFCISVVLFQLVFGGSKFIYQQFIAPFLFGNDLDFKKYGKWARKK